MSDFATFEELSGAGDTAAVRVTLPSGKVMKFRLGHLSYSEWNDIGLQVPEPPVPNTRWDGSRKAPNPQDTGYVRARNDAADKRATMRLARALEKGGMAIPGDTLEDKAASLRTIDTGVVNALLNYLASTGLGLRAELEARAEQFHGVPTGNDEGAEGVAAD